MRYIEKLLWILDENPAKRRGYNEEKVRENIDFVHSLGLKCDCVGWCELDLGDSKAEVYLEEIAAFCKSRDLWARGWYTRTYADTQSSWYKLGTARIPEDSWSLCEIPAWDGEAVRILGSVKAYMLEPHSPKDWHRPIPARVKDALTDMEIPDLTFCWIKDVGRYESQQYYHLYAHAPLPRYYSDRGLKYEIRTDVATEYPKTWERILALGGMLPKVASVFYDLHISLPDCYKAADLPEGGLAEVYNPITFTQHLVDTLLIREDVAQRLLEEKAISTRDLVPVPVVEDCPPGYWEEISRPRPEPSADFIAAREKERLALEAKPRPRRSITEKQALSAIRKAKKERKEDFQKAMPKAAAEALADTLYAPLAPYYAVANGGELSDEYEFLPYARSLEETTIFEGELAAEELLETPPKGSVIAICPDGDRILHLTEGSVIRFSHEVPEVIMMWPTLSQFVYDAINEEA